MHFWRIHLQAVATLSKAKQADTLGDRMPVRAEIHSRELSLDHPTRK
jgi:hypothetical protein